MTPARAGLLALLLTLIFDQASKLGLYFGTDLVLTQPWRLAPFAEPEPLHSSQGTRVGTRIFACFPAKASSSVISRL